MFYCDYAHAHVHIRREHIRREHIRRVHIRRVHNMHVHSTCVLRAFVCTCVFDVQYLHYVHLRIHETVHQHSELQIIRYKLLCHYVHVSRP